MIDRFERFPAALAKRSKRVRLASAPALLAHPDWTAPAPFVLWMHGRTVNKELDPGRYLRWIRAGIGACAIDLPGHGERLDQRLHEHGAMLELHETAVAEIDSVLGALSDFPAFDRSRVAIGGMSAGGMVSLRRLCDPHTFRCATVEAATGWLAPHFASRAGSSDRARLAALDPMENLAAWRPIPLQVLFSEADKVVPIESMRTFLDALRTRYESAGAPPALIELTTWESTGVADEHSGFGRYSNDAKNLQVEFLRRHLDPGPAREDI